MPRGRGSHQRLAVPLALGNRQAVVMGVDAAGQDVVAVDDEVVDGNAGSDIVTGAKNEVYSVACCDMFKCHAKLGKPLAEGGKRALDERGLAVEDVDLGVGHLAVDAKRHADPGHGLEDRHDRVHRPHPRGRIGGRPGRIELGGKGETRGMGRGDVVGLGRLGQVEGHEWREAGPFGKGRDDPLSVAAGIVPGHDGRHEVRHHDGAAEMTGAFGQDAPKHFAVAQVQVPVVGPADDKGVRVHALRLTQSGRASPAPAAA